MGCKVKSSTRWEGEAQEVESTTEYMGERATQSGLGADQHMEKRKQQVEGRREVH